MTSTDVSTEYRFGEYRVDTRQRKLLNRDGESVSLSSRAFDALLLLLERHGQTLTKSELMQAIWPDGGVEMNNLTQAISGLRKALNDNRGDSQFILTVPGRGYSFIAPVEVAMVDLTMPEPAAVAGGDAPAIRTDLLMTPPRGSLHRLGLWAGLAVLAVTGLSAALLFDPAALPSEPSAPAVSTAEPTATASTPNVVPNSIAVLPFTNLTPDDGDKLFAAGLHDEVINQLNTIRSLKVIARNTVVTLSNQGLLMTDIADMLHVESVMSGTIRFAGDQARISLQMLDVATGITLWSGTYDADLTNLAGMISIQSDIARNVASALEAEIAQSEQEGLTTIPTESFKAYRYNLAARYAHSNQNYEKEWNLVQKALALDPGFFDAHYTFASLNTTLVAAPLPGMTSREHYDLALEHTRRMIEIAPRRSEGYALRAVALTTSKDWQGVAESLAKLDELHAPLSTQHFTAMILLCLGQFDKAVELYQANLITQPINTFGRGFLMAALELAGRRDEARLEYDTGEELTPTWWGDTVNVFLSLGRHEQLHDVEELAGVSPELRHLLSNIDNVALVQESLQRFRGQASKPSVEALYYASIAAYHQQHDLAIEFMRASVQGVWSTLFWYWLPVFDETRQQPGFHDLMRESGLIEYWQQNGWPAVCRPVGSDFSCDWRAYPAVVSG